MTLAAIAGKLLGADGFSAYPTLQVGADTSTLVLAALIALSGLAPLRRRSRRTVRTIPAGRPQPPAVTSPVGASRA